MIPDTKGSFNLGRPLKVNQLNLDGRNQTSFDKSLSISIDNNNRMDNDEDYTSDNDQQTEIHLFKNS